MSIIDTLKISSFASSPNRKSAVFDLVSTFEDYKNNIEKGRMLGLIAIESNNGFDCYKWGNYIRHYIYDSYYNLGEDSDILASLVAILEKVEEGLMNDIKLKDTLDRDGIKQDICLIVIKDNITYFVTIGDILIISLNRDDEETNLNNYLDYFEESNVKTASLVLNENDRLNIFKHSTIDRILKLKYKICEEKYKFESLHQTPLEKDNEGILIMQIGYLLSKDFDDVSDQSQFYSNDNIQISNDQNNLPIIADEQEFENIPEVEYNIQNIQNSDIQSNDLAYLDTNNDYNLSNVNIATVDQSNYVEKNDKYIENIIHEAQEKDLAYELLYGKKRPQVVEANTELEDWSQEIIDTNQSIDVYDKDAVNAYDIKNVPNQEIKYIDDTKVKKLDISTGGKRNIKQLNIKEDNVSLLQKFKNNINNFSKSLDNRKYESKDIDKFVRIKSIENDVNELHTKKPLSEVVENKLITKLKTNKKILLFLFVLFCILVIISINIFSIETKKQEELKILNNANTLLVESRQKLVEASSLALTNKSSAKIMLKSIDTKIAEIRKLVGNKLNTEISNLNSDIENTIDQKIEKNISLTITNSFTTELLFKNAVSFIEINGKLYVGTRNAEIYEGTLDMNTNKYGFVNLNIPKLQSNKIDKIVKDLKGNLIIYNQVDGMYIFKLTDKSLTKVANFDTSINPAISDIFAYDLNGQEYIYIINTATGELKRSLKTGDNYGTFETRLKNDIYKVSKSLFIEDGKIFILANGVLKKYSNGNEEPLSFEVSQFATAPSIISDFQMNNNYIFHYDMTNSRVIITDKGDPAKGGKLTFFNSIVNKLKPLNQVLDMLVINDKLFILESDKIIIWKIALQ